MLAVQRGHFESSTITLVLPIALIVRRFKIGRSLLLVTVHFREKLPLYLLLIYVIFSEVFYKIVLFGVGRHIEEILLQSLLSLKTLIGHPVTDQRLLLDYCLYLTKFLGTYFSTRMLLLLHQVLTLQLSLLLRSLPLFPLIIILLPHAKRSPLAPPALPPRKQ